MLRIRLSRRAQADFDQIFDDPVVAAGAHVAARYGRDIRAAINRLSEIPWLGPSRPELGPGVRVVLVAPYMVFYEVGEPAQDLVVLRILHGLARSPMRRSATSR